MFIDCLCFSILRMSLLLLWYSLYIAFTVFRRYGLVQAPLLYRPPGWMTFQFIHTFYLLLQQLFQGLFSSSSGHHLQKPSNALSLKRSGFLHPSSMSSAGCATSLPWGSYSSSAQHGLWRAVSAGCRWCWVLQMDSSSCCRVRTRWRVLNTQLLLNAVCWSHMA